MPDGPAPCTGCKLSRTESGPTPRPIPTRRSGHHLRSYPAVPIRLITALSRREIEILEHASAGRSNKEIARHLGLGSNGVKFHLKNIHAKLGARRRIEAVRIAQEHGLIRIAPPDDTHLTIVVPTKRLSPENARVSITPNSIRGADDHRMMRSAASG